MGTRIPAIQNVEGVGWVGDNKVLLDLRQNVAFRGDSGLLWSGKRG